MDETEDQPSPGETGGSPAVAEQPQPDLSDPTYRSIIATRPQNAPAAWSLADRPDQQTAQARMQDFLRTHAIAGRSYDEMASNFRSSFGGLEPPPPETYKTWEDRRAQEGLLDLVRAQAQKDQPTTSGLVYAAAFPRDIATAYVYGNAKKRFEEGTPTGQDYGVIAHYEQEQQRRASFEQTLGGFLGARALEAPGQLAGFLMGGAAAEGAVAGTSLAGGGIGMALARAPLQAALTPNIGLQGLLQRNIEAGRDPLDLRGVPATVAQGSLQVAAYELSGAALGKVAPNASVLGRAAGAGLAGPFTQQAADLASYAVGAQTRYGSLQDAFEGKWGDVGKHVANDILANALFSLTHGAETAPETATDTATGGQPQPGGPQGPTPFGPGGNGNQNGNQVVTAGLPRRGQAVIDRAVDYFNHLRGMRYTVDAAAREIRRVNRIFTDAVKANPDITSDEILDRFDGYTGPSRAFIEAMADNLPKRVAPEPQNEPPAEPPVASPSVAQEPPTPPEAQQPAQTADRASVGQPAAAPAAPEPAPAQPENRKPGRIQAGEGEIIRRGQRDLDPAEAHAIETFGEGNVVRIPLMRDGDRVGHATVAEEGDSLHVAWMGATGMAGGEGRGNHPFGSREVFSLAGDLARAVPDAKWLKYTPAEGRIGAGKQRIIDLDALRNRGADTRPPAEKLAELDKLARAGHPVSFDQIFDAAGMTPDERDAFLGFHPDVGGKSLRAMAADLGVSHETVRKRLNSAIEKLGLSPDVKARLLDQEKLEHEHDGIIDGRIADPADVKKATRKSTRDAAAKEQARLDQWGNWLSKQGALNESDQARIAERIRRGETAPGYERKVAQRPAQQPAPVPPANAPLPVGAPAVANPGPQPGSPAGGGPAPGPADAGQPQAAGDELARRQAERAAANQRAAEAKANLDRQRRAYADELRRSPAKLAARVAHRLKRADLEKLAKSLGVKHVGSMPKDRLALAAVKTPKGVDALIGHIGEPPVVQEGARRRRIEQRFPEVFAAARQGGVDFGALHGYAQELLAQGKEHDEAFQAMLKDAREGLKAEGTSPQKLAAIFRAGGDHSGVRGFDTVLRSIAGRHPGFFGGYRGYEGDGGPEETYDAAEALWSYLKGEWPGGIPRAPMTEQQAYEQALEEGLAHRERELRREAAADNIPAQDAESAVRVGEGEGEDESAAEAAAISGDQGDDPGDFDPAEFGAGAGRHAAPESLDAAVGESFVNAARDFLAGEDGTLWLPGNPAAWRDAGTKLRRAGQFIVDAVGRLNGRMFPATTRLDPAAGEKMAKYATVRPFVELAAEHYLDKVLYPGASDAARRQAGAVLTERRLRYMRFAFKRAAQDARRQSQQHLAAAQQTANPVQQQMHLRESTRQKRRANVYDRWAGNVSSIVGAPGSPIADFATYRRWLNSPSMQRVIRDWEQHFVPVMEANFRAAQGLAPTDPIDSLTQIPGSPINIKALRPGDDPMAPSSVRVSEGGPGTLRNTRARKFRFAESARGDASGYDVDLKNIIEATLNHGVPVARKADMLRQLVDAGLAKWVVEGQPAVFGDDERPGREIPNVRPPIGTQTNLRRQTALSVHPDVYGELRRALAVDEPGAWAAVTNGIMSLPMAGALASGVEAASHTINLAGSMFEPGANPIHLATGIYQRIRDYPAFREKMLKLAEIGAVKPHGMESGTISQQLQRAAGLFGAKLPDWAHRVDPTLYLGRALHAFDGATRIMLDKAYDHLVATGAMPDTVTGRRDFINRTGQYSAKAQNGFIALLRATGIGPFATAASQMSVNAVRRVFMGGGVGKGVAGTVRMTAEGWARLFGLVGASVVANLLAWKRWDGADDVPFGAIKVGKTKDGRSLYIDTPASLVARRGMRAVGLLAFLDAARHKEVTGATQDKALSDVGHSLAHPAMGPGVQFGYMAATGKNTLGHRVAAKVEHGQAEWPENLKAAARNFNPIYAALTGAKHPREEVSWFERVNDLFGPFGVKTAPPRR